MSLLTEQQAAVFLTLSVKTLQAWRSRGEGPRFIKIGRSVRYDELELRAYLGRQVRDSTSDVGPTNGF